MSEWMKREENEANGLYKKWPGMDVSEGRVCPQGGCSLVDGVLDTFTGEEATAEQQKAFFFFFAIQQFC